MSTETTVKTTITTTRHKIWSRPSKAPTGLRISREGGKFTAEWNIAEPNYDDGQWFKVCILRKGIHDYTYEKKIGKQVKSRVIQKVYNNSKSVLHTFRLSDYYPNGDLGKISSIFVAVAGNRQEIHEKDVKTKTSGDTTYKYITYKDHYYQRSYFAEKEFEVKPPAPPVGLTFALTDNTTNAGTFSWANNTEKNTSSSHAIFTDFEYQTLKKTNWDKPLADAKGLNSWHWEANWHGSATSKSFTETDISEVTGSKKVSITRLFRVRARGPAGNSDWKYAKYVYAIPYDPYLKDGTKVYIDNNVWRFKVMFHVASTYSHPVDTITVEYKVGQPSNYISTNKARRRLIPPTGAFTAGPVTKFAAGDHEYAADFTGDIELSKNNCIWVRVVSTHGPFTQVSDPWSVQSGGLTNPTLNSQSAALEDNVYKLTVSATNNSAVADSGLSKTFIGVFMKRKKDMKAKCIAVLTNPVDTTQYGQPIVKKVNCPNLNNTEYKIGIRTFLGPIGTPKKVYDKVGTHKYYYYEYTVDKDYSMSSITIWSENDSIAQPPDEIAVEPVDQTSVRLSWNWPWIAADVCTISWAKKENAWESTEQPSTYDISSDNHKVTSWVIDGLESDTKYYFRVRLTDTSGSDEKTTEWSETISYDLSAASNMTFSRPVLGSNKSDYNETEAFYLSVATDSKSEDLTYTIAEWDTTNNRVVTRNYGTSAACEQILTTSVGTHQVSFTMSDVNSIYAAAGLTSYLWTTGSEHKLVARITSSEGSSPTEWSEPIPIRIIEAPPVPTISLSGSTFTSMTIEEDIDDSTDLPITRTVTALTAYPISLTIGNTDGNAVEVFIERAASCSMARPDEKREELYDGDILASTLITGDGTVTFESSDINDILDDGMPFRVRAVLTDNYDQLTENSTTFESHFNHQPIIPEATVVMDTEHLAAKITVASPVGYQQGDYFDIYRLSLDRPELIYENAQYGTTYVDPYPTFGDKGGHRIVAKTINNDWKTSDGKLAWLDLENAEGDFVSKAGVRIDFGNQHVDLPYNVSMSNSWAKDFKRTAYLGGSVQGDWNPAVTRDLTVDTIGVTTAVIEGDNTDSLMRRLADYAGVCHVRTSEGSSFSADVQVNESRSYEKPWSITWSLSIKKVDSEAQDGLTLDDWNAIINANDYEAEESS